MMKNTLTENDPRLTAYALGELPRDEAEEVSRMLEANENIILRKEVESLDALGVMLTQDLGVAGSEDKNKFKLKLSPSQRDAIFRSAKVPTAADVRSTQQSAWLRPMLVTLGAAALVTVSFMVLDSVDSNEDDLERMPEVSFSDMSEEVLDAPIQPNDTVWDGISDLDSNVNSVGSSGVDPAGHGKGGRGVRLDESADNLSELVERVWVGRADKAVMRIPMVCGKAGWNWVRHRILEDGVLPNGNAVRVEEIMNAFDYDKPSDLELSSVSAGVDLVRCPWNADSLIAVILIKNTHSDSTQIEAAVTFSESVEKYRLVGYAKDKADDGSEGGGIVAPPLVTMKAGGSHIVMYEIEAVEEMESAAEVLSVDVRTTNLIDGRWVHEDKSLIIQYSDRMWEKVGQEVQFALILASWSQFISDSVYGEEMEVDHLIGMLRSFKGAHQLSDSQNDALEVMEKGIALVGVH